MTAIALLICLVRWWRCSLAGSEFAEQRDRAALHLSAIGFAVLATLVSTAFKPTVQPFHFSYIVPVMCLAAGITVDDILRSRRRSSRFVGIVLLAVVVIEWGATTQRKDFFWRRDEMHCDVRHFALNSFDDPMHVGVSKRPENLLKLYVLHDH